MPSRFLLAWWTALALLLVPALAAAQEKVATCVHVEPGPHDRDALARLVASEVDRHPSHRAVRPVTEKCTVHLRVELIEIGGQRFLTGRVGGEVPDRVRVEGQDGAALEKAVGDLLRVVLGSDPVVLREPGGHSWFSDHVLQLRDHARRTFDVALLESGHLASGRLGFTPGLLLGYTREIVDWQVGVEASVEQTFDEHPGRLALDTQIRLQAAVSHFFSADADASAFAGASLGLAHQRFSGPRAADIGTGDGVYAVTGPALGLRGGVELLRTTSTRAFVMAEALVPVFWANDQQADVAHGWFPGLTLGAGARF